MGAPTDNEGDMAGKFGVLVHAIKKGKGQVRISLSEYKENEYIDIRSFYLRKEGAGDEYLPTRRGVTIPTDSYPELLKGIVELGITLGMLDSDLISELDAKQALDIESADHKPGTPTD